MDTIPKLQTAIHSGLTSANFHLAHTADELTEHDCIKLIDEVAKVQIKAGQLRIAIRGRDGDQGKPQPVSGA